MRFFTNLRISIRNFIKKHKNKLILILIAWIVIIVVNYMLANWKIEDTLITTYTPHEPIIETGEEVPKDLQEKINALIDEYIGYCNSKEYEKAYNMISQECRQAVYPNINEFISYVNYVFKTEKIYNIQNYSNKNGKYFYRVRILDDILLTGLTNTDSVKYFEDRFVIEEKKGQLILSVKEYVESKELEKVYEDKYMKIVVNKKTTMLEEEIYTMQITNRTENYLVIADNSYLTEVTLSTNAEELYIVNEKFGNIVLYPNSKITVEIPFLNFYDEGQIGNTINFKKVRILKNYTIGQKEENEKEENIVEKYGTSMSIK